MVAPGATLAFGEKGLLLLLGAYCVVRALVVQPTHSIVLWQKAAVVAALGSPSRLSHHLPNWIHTLSHKPTQRPCCRHRHARELSHGGV